MDPTPTSSNAEDLKNKIMNNILRINDDDDSHYDQDICRVCRLAGEDTLYHPCLCTGSIKYVHQDCLMQWLKYSKKEVCELCNHKFSFRPVYREDMPERLPLYDVVKGVFVIMVRFLRLFLTYCIVTTCWLGVVPLMASRIYRLVFSGLISSFFSLKILTLFSLENIAVDIIKGSVIVSIFLCTFISLVWLREQIMVGGAPGFMHLPEPENRNQAGGDEENRRVEPPIQVDLLREPNDVENPAPPDPTPAADDATAAAIAPELQAPAQAAGENEPLIPAVDAPIPVDNHNDLPLAPIVPAAAAPPPLADAFNNAANDNNGGDAAAANGNDAERVIDDFTWQRLLGFDGTFAFVEHVFWTISLNIVFNVLFLHWPAQTGLFLFNLLGYSGKIPYFEMPICILAGYVVIFCASLLVHEIARVFRINVLYTMSALVYLMLKVFLLFVVEVVLFPIICGWWLDVCSLPLTGATLDARMKTFRAYPFSSMFLHWLVGMIYVFYSASFILVLRELLRPGVLWFIRNLNDPEFNPVLEMIQQSLTRHCRRLVASTTLFFTIILLVVYLPLRLILWISPGTLPYAFSATADTPMGELSLELILLQIVMPTVLEYSKAFSILKKLVTLWCRVVGGWLKLDSYLLPRRNAPGNNDNNDAAAAPGVRARRENAARAAAAFAAAAGARAANFGVGGEAAAAGDDFNSGEDEGFGAEMEEDVEVVLERHDLTRDVDVNESAADSSSNSLKHRSTAGASNINVGKVEGETSGDKRLKNLIASEFGAWHLHRQSSPSKTNSSNSLTPKLTTDEKKQEADANVPSTSKLADAKAGGSNEEVNALGDVQPKQESSDTVPEQSRREETEPLAAAAGDAPQPAAAAQPPQPPQQRQENHLAVRHQALLMMRELSDFEDYERPDMFAARIVALLVCLAATAVAISFLFFLVPVSIGRALFTIISRFDSGGNSSTAVSSNNNTSGGSNSQQIHDLYTLAAGMYFCWLTSKVWMVAYEWCQKGWDYVCKGFRSMAWLTLRLIAATIPLVIIIPLMLGLHFQLLVVGPLRVSVNQTPLFFPWKEWAIGVVHFKIFCASVLMGPDWWLKTVFEHIYNEGIRGFDLKYLYRNLILPLFNFISLQISLPYVGAKIVLYFLDLTNEEKVIFTRYTYPFTLISVGIVAFLFWQWQKLKSVAQKIRNDKYLIGTQLVNFYRESAAGAALDAAAKSATTTATGGG